MLYSQPFIFFPTFLIRLLQLSIPFSVPHKTNQQFPLTWLLREKLGIQSSRASTLQSDLRLRSERSEQRVFSNKSVLFLGPLQTRVWQQRRTTWERKAAWKCPETCLFVCRTLFWNLLVLFHPLFPCRASERERSERQMFDVHSFFRWLLRGHARNAIVNQAPFKLLSFYSVNWACNINSAVKYFI